MPVRMPPFVCTPGGRLPPISPPRPRVRSFPSRLSVSHGPRVIPPPSSGSPVCPPRVERIPVGYHSRSLRSSKGHVTSIGEEVLRKDLVGWGKTYLGRGLSVFRIRGVDSRARDQDPSVRECGHTATVGLSKTQPTTFPRVGDTTVRFYRPCTVCVGSTVLPDFCPDTPLCPGCKDSRPELCPPRWPGAG